MHMNNKYCLDANIIITAWDVTYPIRTFPTLWKCLAKYCDQLILIKPIYDEIDPSYKKGDQDSQSSAKQWLIDNRLNSIKIDGEIEKISLEMEKKYKIKNNSKGVSQNDIKLIAYAKKHKGTIVTMEADQATTPQEKHNWKIPAVCKDEDVSYIKFIELLDRLKISI